MSPQSKTDIHREWRSVCSVAISAIAAADQRRDPETKCACTNHSLTGSFLGGLSFVAALLMFSTILTVVLARSLQEPKRRALAAYS